MYSRSLSVTRVALFFCAIFLLCSQVQAQFMVGVKLNKTNFMTQENVEATVEILNRTGSDLVMGGPNGGNWLSFEVTDPSGQQVSSLKARSDAVFIFKSGTTISRKILLSNFYSFSEAGYYLIAASVYHAPSQQYYTSTKVRASFVDVKPINAGIPYGVPAGLPNAGQARRYTLHLMRDAERVNMYVRVTEELSKLKISTIPLGPCIMVVDPQVSIDNSNKLHLLFMAAPQVYAHVTVDTQGVLAQREYFRAEKTDRPQLMAQTDGAITVQGGIPFDPNAIPEKATPKGRSIRQRPPGL